MKTDRNEKEKGKKVEITLPHLSLAIQHSGLFWYLSGFLSLPNLIPLLLIKMLQIHQGVMGSFVYLLFFFIPQDLVGFNAGL